MDEGPGRAPGVWDGRRQAHQDVGVAALLEVGIVLLAAPGPPAGAAVGDRQNRRRIL
jgi:hypothetical protein